ncbi:MAG: D-alanine--D-alanine ligase [Thermonema sp.]|uniref:hypothetical protein n=1 Tax=Thermonema sp. TaxID=2231181 RepID=UPI0021DE499D|nr:hypothetical protein [Thermonema sp.]GIV40072.1 MAG: D-alanine--D-alanine ligase [Thermonema sp.]
MNKWWKYLKWEFWPFWFFYIPVYFYWFYLSLRARSFAFFTAANPGMFLGGFTMYSKYDILRRIPSQYVPKSLWIAENTPVEEIINKIKKRKLRYPLAVKPDRGERGFAVARIENEEQLRNFLAAYPAWEWLVQEWCDAPIELGIMYCRMPGASHGQITSIVVKEPLQIKGDGTHTIGELIKKDERCRYHLDFLQKTYASRWNEIPEAGSKIQLTHIGNHSRGATFRNGHYLLTPQLQRVINEIARHIDGFYFGRFDLKVPSIEDLYAGRNICILELNGANSEPTHIYDPGMPLWKAYRDLFKHWQMLYLISVANHKRGVRYAPFSLLLKAIKSNLYKRKTYGQKQTAAPHMD